MVQSKTVSVATVYIYRFLNIYSFYHKQEDDAKSDPNDEYCNFIRRVSFWMIARITSRRSL